MSKKSRSYEQRELRKCKNKISYNNSLVAEDAIDKFMICNKILFESYVCDWCKKIHLTKIA